MADHRDSQPPNEGRPSAKARPAARARRKPAAPRTAREEPEVGAGAGKKRASATEKPEPTKRPAAKAKAKARRARSVPTPGVQVDQEELETVAAEPVPTEPGFREAPVEARLHGLERDLDRLLQEAGDTSDDPVARRRAAQALTQLAARLSPEMEHGETTEGPLGTARELLSTDFYFRQWGRAAMRNRSDDVDELGLDPTYEKRVRPLFHSLYRKWFRVRTKGIEQVPQEGRAMIVANHSGTVPWDGVMLKTAMELEHPRQKLRWLAEDFVFHMPFLGAFMNRIGAVRACQENAERLLRREELVAVFPEGIKGIGKLFRQRYQLQRFGRGGYIKLALRTGTPIIPCAIVGAEETNPMLFKVTRLAKGLGLPYVPVTPTFPLLGPLGLLPAPSRWTMLFGEPILLDEHGPEDAEDAVLVNRLNDRVRSTIQHMLDEALRRRSSVFL